MRTLVLIAPEPSSFERSGRALVRAASQFGEEISALVLGPQNEALTKSVGLVPGVKQVYWAKNAVFSTVLAEAVSACILSLSDQHDVILAESSTFGKNILPRVAAQLDVAQLSDVIKVLTHDTFEHPIYAGNAIETIQLLDRIKVLTVRTTAFMPMEGTQDLCPVMPLDQAFPLERVAFKSIAEAVSVRPELSQASIVVAGGRGLQSAVQFKLIEQLADCLGAAIGASRAAVDAGFVSNDLQVGQTGKVVAPQLYFAIGISGAIQHIAGMKEAKVIVAINKDPDAPIFQVATYGLVGDLFQIVPELIEKINKS